MGTTKKIEPKNPEAAAEKTEEKTEADRKTMGQRHPRKMGRKTMYGRHYATTRSLQPPRAPRMWTGAAARLPGCTRPRRGCFAG